MNRKTPFLFQAINTVVILLCLIGSGCGKHSDVKSFGQPLFSVALGAEQNVILPASPGLLYSPDEHLSYLRTATGSMNMWFAANEGTVGFSTPDLLALTSLKSAGGVPSQLLAPSRAGTTAFDADYAGAGSVFRAANGTDLLMIYHAENHLFGTVHSTGNPFYVGIGLARSTDGGITWQRQGQILSGKDPQLATQHQAGRALQRRRPLKLMAIFMFFSGRSTCKARWRLSVLHAHLSRLTLPPAAGISIRAGRFLHRVLEAHLPHCRLFLDAAAPSDQRQPFVTFNTALNAYVLTIVGNGGIYLCTSTDLINWSAGQVILPAPVPDATVTPSTAPYNWYPTLVSLDQPSETTTDQTGYLYYAKGANDGTSYHTL